MVTRLSGLSVTSSMRGGVCDDVAFCDLVFVADSGAEGQTARKASGRSYLIQALADYRDCGSQVTCLIDKEVTCAMSTRRCVTLGS